MTENTTQIGTRLDESLWQEFREDVKRRKGAVRGHLKHELENALRAYLDGSAGGDTNDRLQRIETSLQDIQATLDEMDRKNKHSDVGKTVEKRADKIEQMIEEQTGGGEFVGNKLVEMAIKEVAGGSPPTIKQYKQILQERRALFPHPTKDGKYVRDRQTWVQMTQQFRENGAISQDRYVELVDTIGRDQFVTIYNEQVADEGERGRAFQ